jgi:hypothetical protein
MLKKGDCVEVNKNIGLDQRYLAKPPTPIPIYIKHGCITRGRGGGVLAGFFSSSGGRVVLNQAAMPAM